MLNKEQYIEWLLSDDGMVTGLGNLAPEYGKILKDLIRNIDFHKINENVFILVSPCIVKIVISILGKGTNLPCRIYPNEIDKALGIIDVNDIVNSFNADIAFIIQTLQNVFTHIDAEAQAVDIFSKNYILQIRKQLDGKAANV